MKCSVLHRNKGPGDISSLKTGQSVFLRYLAELNVASAVRQSGDASEYAGKPSLLRYFECPPGHILRFLKGCGFQEGQIGESGVVAAVLFVRTGNSRRVVGGYEDKAALCAGQIDCHQEIGTYVNPVLFHGHYSSEPGQRGRRCRFRGDDLIG